MGEGLGAALPDLMMSSNEIDGLVFAIVQGQERKQYLKESGGEIGWKSGLKGGGEKSSAQLHVEP